MTFASRHIGPDSGEQAQMLEAIGYASLDALMDAAIPEVIRRHGSLALPAGASEEETIAELRAIAARNTVATSMIGLGYYGTFTPAVIRRNVLENPAWYTAYTPYPPEISQGRLEALAKLQTKASALSGLATANASMLDEGTAVAEAMTLARRASKGKSMVYAVDTDTLPQTLAGLPPPGRRRCRCCVPGRSRWASRSCRSTWTPGRRCRRSSSVCTCSTRARRA